MCLVYTVPLPPLPIGIMELRAKTPKIFEFKGVIWKIFRNKDLGVKNDTDSVLVSLFVAPAPVAIVRSSRCKRAPKLRA